MVKQAGFPEGKLFVCYSLYSFSQGFIIKKGSNVSLGGLSDAVCGHAQRGSHNYASNLG
jgi:hypothetical protein